MTSAFLGVDTSNYTTSAALVTCADEVFSSKRLLPVPAGARGMRQSEALFCHTRDLGEILGEAVAAWRRAAPDGEICAVGVSTRPRDREGSYMPCFLAGLNAARAAAEALGAPLVETSHQEGHIAAAAFGAALLGKPLPEGAPFRALHLSGGTGELLLAERREQGYKTRVLASFLDITPGQLIDRCGVKMGLSFPAGRDLEKLAEKGRFDGKIRPAVKEDGVSLSGFENQFDRLLADGASPEDAAAFVFAAVEAGIRSLLACGGAADAPAVLFSGGVASSHLLRERLAERDHYFTRPDLASDNAVGVALIARDARKGEHGWDLRQPSP